MKTKDFCLLFTLFSSWSYPYLMEKYTYILTKDIAVIATNGPKMG